MLGNRGMTWRMETLVLLFSSWSKVCFGATRRASNQALIVVFSIKSVRETQSCALLNVSGVGGPKPAPNEIKRVSRSSGLGRCHELRGTD